MLLGGFHRNHRGRKKGTSRPFLLPITNCGLSAPEYSLRDDLGYFRSQLFSLQILIPQIMKIDLTQLGHNFSVPIFFFEGKHDPYCRPSLVRDYFQKINAPQKEFVQFDDSDHFPFFEQKQKFADELLQLLMLLGR